MRVFLLVSAILTIFAVSIQTQSSARPTWDQNRLNQEIDKGTDPDDPAKMIRYWRKITDGTITPSELDMLKALASRPAPRECCLRPDDTLYLSVFAGQLVSLHEERLRHTQEVSHLQNQVSVLGAKVTELGTALIDVRKALATLDP